MPTKTQSYFGRSLGNALTHTSAAANLTHYNPQEAITPRHATLFEEADIQNRAIEAQGTKGRFAQAQLAELAQLTAHLFDDTVSEIVDIQNVARDREHQAILDEFTRLHISMYGRQTLGILDVTGTNIAREVHRSIYAPPIPPEPKRRGFWRR